MTLIPVPPALILIDPSRLVTLRMARDSRSEVNCPDLVAGQRYDVTIFFPDLAREPVQVRWVTQVGDANFDGKDGNWWWTDEEYPDAVGVYVAKLNNSAYLDRQSGLLA